jgi:predicted SAM-dependent methyltransferase
MSEPIRLNIGAGESNLPGFISVDIKTGTDASEKLPYETGTVDEVYASHVLEHIHFSKHVATVREWVRVLKPGGKIRIAVPNFDMVLGQYMAGEISPDKLNAWLHGGLPEDTDRHKIATFNPDRLSSLMRRCGVVNIEEFEPEYEDCTLLAESMNFVGTKRKHDIKDSPKVCMVMSRPRVGFMDCADRITEAARQLQWPYVGAEGTEWGRVPARLRQRVRPG